jgi:hypothetical protein
MVKTRSNWLLYSPVKLKVSQDISHFNQDISHFNNEEQPRPVALKGFSDLFGGDLLFEPLVVSIRKQGWPLRISACPVR